MVIYGIFKRDFGMMPTFFCNLSHPAIKTEISLPFTIDIGANYTLISPDHQQLLQISPNSFEKSQEVHHIMAGKVLLRVLRNCSLTFVDTQNNILKIEKLPIYFLPKNIKKQHKNTDVVFPSILGRDVLDKFAFGYCQQTQQAFLTDEIDKYFSLTAATFPAPTYEGLTWEDFSSSVSELDVKMRSSHEKAKAAFKRLDSMREEAEHGSI